MAQLADVLNTTLDQVGREATDAQFLASEHWPTVVAAARQALAALTE